MLEEKSKKVHGELNRLVTDLVLPAEVREASERLAATLLAKKLVDRISPPIIAASSLYAASRDSQTPLTLKELAASSGSSPKEIGRCYRRIVGEMGLKPPAPDAALYTIRVAERAHVSEMATNLSSVIARQVVERGLEGRNPMTLAAAAVYTASLMMGENMTQSDAAEAASVDEASVRKCAKAIRQSIGTPARKRGGGSRRRASTTPGSGIEKTRKGLSSDKDAGEIATSQAEASNAQIGVERSN